MSALARWDDDEALIRDLAAAFATREADRARAGARAAFAWRTIDQDLTGLVDQATPSQVPPVRRATTGPYAAAAVRRRRRTRLGRAGGAARRTAVRSAWQMSGPHWARLW
jgi:hypothetical protein